MAWKQTLPLMFLACGARSPLGVDDSAGPTAVGKSQSALCHSGDGPVVLARTNSYPTSVAVDDANAYWWSGADGTVRSVPLAGGDAKKLADSPDVLFDGRLLLDHATLYWSGDERGIEHDHDGWLMEADIGGGGVTSFVEHLDAPLLLAAHAGTLDLVTSREEAGHFTHVVSRRAPDGSSTTLVSAFTTQDRLFGMRVAYDGKRFFYADRGKLQVAVIGGGTSTLGTAITIAAVDANGTELAWIACDGRLGRVLVGEAAREAYRFGASCPAFGPLRLSATHVYTVDGTKLVRVPLDGAPPEIIFDDYDPSAIGPPPGGGLFYGSNPVDMAVDTSCVYALFGSALVRFPR
jgi:hypothetical protein